MTNQSFSISTHISADPRQTWYNYFNLINHWWSKDFYTSSRTKKIVIETSIGGKMFEDFGEGEGLIWGEVIGVDLSKSLHLLGYLSPGFGGPALSFDQYLFHPEGDGTLFEYKSDFIGPIAEKTVNRLEAGWKDIFQLHFKPFCEK